MTKWEIIALVATLTTNGVLVAISVIPAFFKVKDGRFKRLLNKLTKEGIILVALAIFALITPLFQAYVNYNVDKGKEEKRFLSDSLSKEKAIIHDSIMAANYETQLAINEKKVISSFTESLAKFGLKNDSISKKIILTISDSSQNYAIPELSFCLSDGLKVDSVSVNYYKISIFLCNSVAPSRIVKMNIYLALIQDEKITYIQNKTKKYRIGQDQPMGTDQFIGTHYFLTLRAPAIIVCMLDGSFEDRNGRVRKVRQMTGYDMSTRRFGPLNDVDTDLDLDKLKNGFFTSGFYPDLKR